MDFAIKVDGMDIHISNETDSRSHVQSYVHLHADRNRHGKFYFEPSVTAEELKRFATAWAHFITASNKGEKPRP